MNVSCQQILKKELMNMFRIQYPHLDMKKIAESGQIFRFNVYDDEYSLVAGDKLLFIKEDDDGYILSCSESEFEEFWTDYFDLRLDTVILKRIFRLMICF